MHTAALTSARCTRPWGKLPRNSPLPGSISSAYRPTSFAVIGFGFKGPALLSRTTDGGATWEPARIIFDSGANQQTIGNQIVVLPDGTLVDFFNLIRNQPPRFEFTLALIRSTDRGATWTHGQPIRAARMFTKAAFDPQATGVRDPDTGARVRTGDIIPEVAVDRSPKSRGYGNLYAVWQDSRFSNNGDFSNLDLLIDEVAFSRSTDGGLTWSTPIKINLTPTNIPLKNRQAFTPAIRVAADGTLGVTYSIFATTHPIRRRSRPTSSWCIPTTRA